jgi:hypothetical protein
VRPGSGVAEAPQQVAALLNSSAWLEQTLQAAAAPFQLKAAGGAGAAPAMSLTLVGAAGVHCASHRLEHMSAPTGSGCNGRDGEVCVFACPRGFTATGAHTCQVSRRPPHPCFVGASCL